MAYGAGSEQEQPEAVVEVDETLVEDLEVHANAENNAPIVGSKKTRGLRVGLSNVTAVGWKASPSAAQES